MYFALADQIRTKKYYSDQIRPTTRFCSYK